jgi:hypothetical protein
MTESIATRWEAYSEAGRRCFGEKQLERAEEAFLAALRAAEHFGDEDPRLAVSLNNLARVYGRREKFFPAAALLHRLLGMKERQLGEEHPELAGVLTNLADMYAKLGDLRQELALRERALDVRGRAAGVTEEALAPLRAKAEKVRRAIAEEGGPRAPAPHPAPAPAPVAPRGNGAPSKPTVHIPTPLRAPQLEAALIWPEPPVRADAETAAAPEPPRVPRAAAAPEPRREQPVQAPARESVPAAAASPRHAPLAPPISPVLASVPADAAVADAGPMAPMPRARSWRMPAIGGAAAVALVAAVLLGRGLVGGDATAAAASRGQGVDSAAGAVSGVAGAVSEEEAMRVGLATIRQSEPAPTVSGTPSRSADASAAQPAPSASPQRLVYRAADPVEEAERVERSRDTRAETDTQPTRPAPSLAIPSVTLDNVSQSIERAARARVDSTTMPAAVKEPTFRRPAVRVP